MRSSGSGETNLLLKGSDRARPVVTTVWFVVAPRRDRQTVLRQRWASAPISAALNMGRVPWLVVSFTAGCLPAGRVRDALDMHDTSRNRGIDGANDACGGEGDARLAIEVPRKATLDQARPKAPP